MKKTETRQGETRANGGWPITGRTHTGGHHDKDDPRSDSRLSEGEREGHVKTVPTAAPLSQLATGGARVIMMRGRSELPNTRTLTCAQTPTSFSNPCCRRR